MWNFSIIQDWKCVWKEEHLNKWNNLLKESPTSHVFYHPLLVQIWIDTYTPLRDISPIFIWGESPKGNRVFLPMVLWKKNWKNAFISTIIPIGYSDYDYHDPLFLEHPTDEELSSFWEELIAKLRTFNADEILLTGFRDGCYIKDNHWKQDEICPSLNLSKISSEEDLMSFFGTKLRGDIRRQIRRLEEMGTLKFVEYSSVQEIPTGVFEQFMDAHCKKWPKAYKAPKFHNLLVKSCSANGPIHFSVMQLNDEAIAWHLGFEWQGVYYYYMPAGNPKYLKQSPVKIHLYNLLVRAINKRYCIYDHLRGDETYKAGWSDSFQYVNNRCVKNKCISSKIKHCIIKLKTLIG